MVDFTSLAHWAGRAGFIFHGLTDQYRLLQRLAERISADPAAWGRLSGSGPTGNPGERFRRTMGLRSLLSPEGLSGSCRVMVLSRGVEEPLPLLEGLRTTSGFDPRVE